MALKVVAIIAIEVVIIIIKIIIRLNPKNKINPVITWTLSFSLFTVYTVALEED